jgi:hypothetical protein
MVGTVLIVYSVKSYAFTSDVYKMPNGLKTIFWKRYNSWYLSHFILGQPYLKAGKTVLFQRNSEKQLGFQQIYDQDNLQVVVIKDIYSNKQDVPQLSHKCNLVINFPKKLMEYCGAVAKKWHKSVCPKTLTIKQSKLIFKSTDKCFQNGDDSMVVSQYLHEDFYSKFWPKVYYSLAAEFMYYPKGIIWNKKEEVKLYYW